MEYVSAAEAAERWGISARRIQRLCMDGRIVGAKKYGNAWMIPAKADKPTDPRRERVCPTKFLPFTLMTAASPLCRDGAGLNGKGERAQYEAEMQYLKCNYAEAALLAELSARFESTALCSYTLLAAIAIDTGDYELFERTVDRLALFAMASRNNYVAQRLVELSQMTISASIYTPERCPDWLADGELEELPDEMKPLAAYTYAKYLGCIGNTERAIGVAGALVCMRSKGERNISDIYAAVLCAVLCLKNGNESGARKSLKLALDIAAPLGLVCPFLEYYEPLKAIFEECAREYTGFHDSVREHWETVRPNWARLYAEITQKNITYILTLREYGMARLAKDGLTDEDIAAKLNLQLSDVKLTMKSVLTKLRIRSRSQIVKYIS